MDHQFAAEIVSRALKVLGYVISEEELLPVMMDLDKQIQIGEAHETLEYYFSLAQSQSSNSPSSVDPDLLPWEDEDHPR